MGVPIAKRDSELSVSLEIDTAERSLTEFLTTLPSFADFTDISVRALPMDMIITKIYNAEIEL